MESSSALALTQLPYVYPAIPSSNRVYPIWPAKRRSSQPTRLHCNKMFVPGWFSQLQIFTLVTTYKVVFSLYNCTVLMLSGMQDSEKHHQKQRLLQTSTISSPSLLLKSLLLNLRFLLPLPAFVVFVCFLAYHMQNSFKNEQSYNPEAYEELMEFVGRHSLDDGDKFCATMFRESSRHKNLGKDSYQATQS